MLSRVIDCVMAASSECRWELGSFTDTKHCVVYSLALKKISGFDHQLSPDQSSQSKPNSRVKLKISCSCTLVPSSSHFLLFLLAIITLSFYLIFLFPQFLCVIFSFSSVFTSPQAFNLHSHFSPFSFPFLLIIHKPFFLSLLLLRSLSRLSFSSLAPNPRMKLHIVAF